MACPPWFQFRVHMYVCAYLFRNGAIRHVACSALASAAYACACSTLLCCLCDCMACLLSPRATIIHCMMSCCEGERGW